MVAYGAASIEIDLLLIADAHAHGARVVAFAPGGTEGAGGQPRADAAECESGFGAATLDRSLFRWCAICILIG